MRELENNAVELRADVGILREALNAVKGALVVRNDTKDVELVRLIDAALWKERDLVETGEVGGLLGLSEDE